MELIGEYKKTDFKISEGKYATVYTGFDKNQKSVAIKEVIQSEFTPNTLTQDSQLI